jgi:hypothetical protein
MSEQSKTKSWDDADKDAEEKMIFQVPEGTTMIKPMFAQSVELSRFEGKYIIFCEIDKKLKRLSVGAKILRKMKEGHDRGVECFALTRVGLDMNSRFTIQDQLPLKKK